jgi:membrane protease YdiL (CAAX protease family)
LLLVLAGIGLGTVLLDQGVRLAILWVAMLGLGLAYTSRHPQREELSLADIGRGALIGLVAGAPFAAFLVRPLRVFSERLYATDDALLLFYQTSLVAAVAEELLFRGVLQPAKGLWLAAAAYGAMGVLYFAPHSPILVTCIVSGAMFVLGAIYGHVRKQYGLYAAVACHAMAAFVLCVVPAIVGAWQVLLA